MRHMGDYGRDLGNTYFSNPFKKKDSIAMITGPVMAAASLLLEGTDQMYSAVVGPEYEAPHGIGGRTRRDVKALLKDVVTLHPLRAAGDAWRAITSSWILDTGDALGGHRLSDGVHSRNTK